jgi:hypothetical protein
MGTPKPAGFRGIKALSEEEAEALTAEIVDKLTTAYQDVAPLVVRAFHGRAWNAVGYTTWDDYCRANFHGPRMLRFSEEQLTELCVEFAGEGMSVRAIGSALGIGHATAGRKIRGADKDGEREPAEVIGLDGRRQTRERRRAMADHPAGKKMPAPANLPAAEVVFMHVSLSGDDGLTYEELCAVTGWRDARVTGALSVLVRAGRIRQDTRRDMHAVWVEA